MKKFYLIALTAVLAGCAQMSSMTGASSDSTVSARMKTCLISEANSRYQAGTLFTNTIKATATDMVKTCSRNLALQSAGITPETQATAEGIISNLRTMAGY